MNETLKKQYLAKVAALQEAVEGLSTLYTEHPELNDLQPDGFSECIPMSLDEWAANLGLIIEKIEDPEKEYSNYLNDAFRKLAIEGCED